MSATIANVDMAQAWNGPEGDDWARDWEHYDEGVRGYHARLLGAAAVREGERVLDVGCGNGQVCRDLAARGAHAVGIDLSRQMVARARELAAGTDAEFVEGDAQVHPFPEASFDVVLSRFGAMFFADRDAAFRNLARATRPGGRLVLVAWQPLEHNEWLQEVRAALALGRDLPAPPSGAPGPFGLADSEATCAQLRAAGFGDATATPVEEDFVAGRDVDDAVGFLGSTGVVRGLLESLPPGQQAQGRAALRDSFERHAGPAGVVYASACWLYRGSRAA